MSRVIPLCSLCALLLFSGCLTATRKIIKLHLNPDGSGTGSMIFNDIQSMQENDDDRSLQDYNDLVNEWLSGNAFENANPSLYDVKKRLGGDKNVLNGEITFSFSSYLDVGLYRYQNSGPWMYYAYQQTSDIESFEVSDGNFGGEGMPVIFWPEGTTEFKIANIFDHKDRPVHSLYSLYKKLGTTPQEDDE